MSRPRIVLPRAVLLQESGATADLLRRLERAGLVVPVARGTTEVYYAADARAQVERVRALLQAGYAERDIAHVIGKVSGTAVERVEVVEPAEAFARTLGCPPERVLDLERRGLAPAWARTEAGELLFASSSADLVRGLIALDVLGLADYLPAWSRAHLTPAEVDLSTLRADLGARLMAHERAASELARLLAALGRGESAPRRPRGAAAPALAKLIPRRRARTTRHDKR